MIYDIFLQAQDCDSTWAQYVFVFPADNDRDGIYYTDPNAKTIVSISAQRNAEGKIKDVTLCDVLDMRYHKSIDHKMFMFDGQNIGKSDLWRKKDYCQIHRLRKRHKQRHTRQPGH